MRLSIYLLCCLSLLLAATLRAQQTDAAPEQMYVSDKLVIGVFPQPDSEADKITNLESGDSVQVLEHQNKYARVRLMDGREGWLRASYLTKQAPAIVQLKELQSAQATAATTLEQTQASQEIARLKEQNQQLQTERDSLKKQAAENLAQAKAATAATSQQTAAVPQVLPVAQAKQSGNEASEDSKDSKDNASENINANPTNSLEQLLGIGAALLLAGVGVGFAFGYTTLARRIRRKYGSVKIY